MSKRFLALVVIFIVVIAAILLALFFRPRPSGAPAQVPVTQTTPSVAVPAPTPTQEQQAQKSAVALQAVAKLFTERYGSFSTEAQYANLTDVLPLMTESLAEQTRAVINAAKPSVVFYGVSTRAVTVKVGERTATSATVTVSTQRVETKGTAAPATKYQDLILSLEKAGEDWKVAAATWR